MLFYLQFCDNIRWQILAADDQGLSKYHKFYLSICIFFNFIIRFSRNIHMKCMKIDLVKHFPAQINKKKNDLHIAKKLAC